MNGTVTAVAAAAFVGLEWPVVAFLRFDAQIPCEVTMTLRVGLCVCGQCEDEATDEVTLYFARDLLDEAVGGPAEVEFGQGDVIIKRLITEDFLQFTFPSGAERPLLVEYEPVRDFMIRSYMLVPFDDDAADGAVEAAIAKILEAAS